MRCSLVDAATHDVARFHFIMRGVELVRVADDVDGAPDDPSSPPKTGASPTPETVHLAYEVVCEREAAATEEWMYTLQHDDADPNHTVTEALVALSEGRAVDALALLRGITAAAVTESGSVQRLSQVCDAAIRSR